jgi:tRNA dimethylallyltransferase
MKEHSSKNKVIAVVGPTASGKTAYAINLAKQIGGEIISADSRLVYKGFNIGTAKPSVEEQDGIPHYMIDIVEPEYNYTAGLYKQEAEKHIDDILKRGKTPIITGGTGLYIDILLKNFDLPKIEPDINLRKELSNLEKEELYNMLISLDSGAQNIININDKRKIIRAIEIIKSTGKTLNNARGISDSKYDIKWIGKNFERKILYERIDKRVDMMISSGLVDETKYLLKNHGRIQNLVGTIGYREMIGYIDGKMSLDDSINLLKQNTRRYAKRQLTWFRRNEAIEWDIYPEKLSK